MVTTVIDYLIVVTDMGDDDGATPAGWTGPISLPRDVRIEQLDHALGERLLDACEFRGERWSPARQYSVMHAYVREVPDRAGQKTSTAGTPKACCTRRSRCRG